jgi:hypothetical protein
LNSVAEMLTALFPVMTASAALAETPFMKSMWERVLKLPLNARQIEVLSVCGPSEDSKIRLLSMYVSADGANDNPVWVVENIPSIKNLPKYTQHNLCMFMLHNYQSAVCRDWMLKNIMSKSFYEGCGFNGDVYFDEVQSLVSGFGNVQYMKFNQVLTLGKKVLEKDPGRTVFTFGTSSPVEAEFKHTRENINNVLNAIKSNKPFELTSDNLLDTIHQQMGEIFTELSFMLKNGKKVASSTRSMINISVVVPAREVKLLLKQLFCLQKFAVVLREFTAIQLVETNDNRKPRAVDDSKIVAQEGVAESKANSAENEEGDGIRMTDVKATFTGASAAAAVSTSVSSIASDAKRCGAG